MLELTAALVDGLPKNGPTDPIEYYRKPLIGRLFRHRINIGLGLVPTGRYRAALEIGYGAGAVMLALAPAVEDLHGIDLDADPEPVRRLLASRGQHATLVQGSVYDLPYADRTFDLVVSFSVFEHLAEYRRALKEVARVLTPGGLFLLGMPAVNRMMEVGFRAIGFRGINDHHVTTPAQVASCFDECGFALKHSKRLDVPVRPVTLYFTWLLQPRLA
jgi:ubiquinone/menaquinone biosynthesis C-methylase UbiE